MRETIVLVDMDDVMCNFIESLCNWLNKEYGTGTTVNDITEWELSRFFPGLSINEIFNPTHTEEFWQTVKPIEGAREFIRKLMHEGYKVYICTASDYRTIKYKFDWVLKRYFPYISWRQVIITKEKGMIRGDILVDDGVHNLENTSFDKILMTTPSNQKYDAEAHGMTRAKSWKEVYDIIHDYTKRREEK